MATERKFAEGTTVSEERTRAEIEQALKRYGANAFGYMADDKLAAIQFRCREKYVRFVLMMPDPKNKEFTHKNSWTRRSDSDRDKRIDAERRRLWRALLLVIKSKLEASTSGISTFESEFMAHIVMPDGVTVGERFLPQIEQEARKAVNSPPMRTALPEPDDAIDCEGVPA